MCSRERPESLGPGPCLLATLEASTTGMTFVFQGFADNFLERPPASRPRIEGVDALFEGQSMILIDSAFHCWPKIIVPRVISEILRPVRPIFCTAC